MPNFPGDIEPVNVLFPADWDDLSIAGEKEGIFVLPLVGDDNEGTGIALNTGIEVPVKWGDIVTWISPSPETQKATIVARGPLLDKSFDEKSLTELRKVAQKSHKHYEYARKEGVTRMEILECDICATPGMGPMVPNEVWKEKIPKHLQKKVLCEGCMRDYGAYPAKGAFDIGGNSLHKPKERVRRHQRSR